MSILSEVWHVGSSEVIWSGMLKWLVFDLTNEKFLGNFINYQKGKLIFKLRVSGGYSSHYWLQTVNFGVY